MLFSADLVHCSYFRWFATLSTKDKSGPRSSRRRSCSGPTALHAAEAAKEVAGAARFHTKKAAVVVQPKVAVAAAERVGLWTQSTRPGFAPRQKRLLRSWLA